MSTATQEEKSFILELHKMTGGDVDAQVSMYDIGATLGMDKGATTAMSQDLMIEELVELKTLSGGIGITRKGLDLLQRDGLIAGAALPVVSLSRGLIIDRQDREQIDGLLNEINRGIYSSSTRYEQLAELVIDVKTLETQLLSPRPKTAVVRATLASAIHSLAAVGSGELSEKIKDFIGE